MTLTLYVGNAMKDLVCAPRPMGLKHGKARVKALGAGSEEAAQNAKVGVAPSLRGVQARHLFVRTIFFAVFLALVMHAWLSSLVSPRASHYMHACCCAAGIWAALLTHHELLVPQFLRRALPA
jgi:hypothetical protein